MNDFPVILKNVTRPAIQFFLKQQTQSLPLVQRRKIRNPETVADATNGNVFAGNKGIPRLINLTRVTSQARSINRGAQCRCLHRTTYSCHDVTSFVTPAY